MDLKSLVSDTDGMNTKELKVFSIERCLSARHFPLPAAACHSSLRQTSLQEAIPIVLTGTPSVAALVLHPSSYLPVPICSSVCG